MKADLGCNTYYPQEIGEMFTLTSPNFPQNYPPGSDVCYEIITQPGYALQLQFTEDSVVNLLKKTFKNYFNFS